MKSKGTHWISVVHKVKKSKSIPAPMAHRAAPISVSVALSHASVNAV